MKIKSLLMGMAAFLGFALAGCSDDVIDVNNQEQQVSNEPAYLSVSFSGSSTSSRSTADDANNQGDKDGDQEHSGHINLGTADENNVNNALVVIKSTQQGVKGYARLYATNTYNKENTNAKYGLGILKPTSATGGETFYTAGEPIELTANTFEVLVVANPYKGLYSEFETALTSGTNDANVVDGLFYNITTGKYNVQETTFTNFAGDIVNIENENVTGIMMANKELPQVKLVPAKTQTVEIPIERVASKITFRITNKNVYPIEVPDPSTVVIKTESADANNDGTAETLNLYTYNNTTYYVVTKGENNAFDSAYTKNDDGSYTKAEEFTEEVFKKATAVTTYKINTWYVKLEKYALVNLAKSVYNVRHIINGTDVVPFDKLNGENFLYTPLWETANGNTYGINEVTFWKADDTDLENNTPGTFKNITNTDAWFFNTLQKVSDESDAVLAEGKTWTYFTDLKDSYDDLDSDKVEANQNVANNNKQHEDLANIGYPLAYCLENSTDIEHQTHGLSTGITFMAKIYSEYTDENNNTPIKDMYRYKGYVFSGIDAIKTAFPNDGLADNLTDNSDPTEIEAAGITRYDSNTCYYYTTEIKHFDNDVYPDAELKEDKTTLGNMEFAIMRNNIYSLAVTAIEKIGDPYVDPIPSTPDEIAKPKLKVEAKIMPWIVRYHNIDFK